MKRKITMLIRVLFGVFFFVMGLNYFFNFLQLPPLSVEGLNFIMALKNTGYILPFNAGLEIVTGLMLVFNLFVPFALVLLAPLIIHIAFFHIFLDSATLGLPLTVVFVELFLVAMYWDNFSHFFKRR